MRILITAIVHALSAIIAWAAPAGICLHSYSPLAPPDKIECFEYLKFEKAGEDYRFFLYPNGSTIVPKNRFRAVIPYAENLLPGNPKFNSTLDMYVKTATESPSTRRFLNPRIRAMRDLASSYNKIEQMESPPEINIKLKNNITLKNCKATRLEGNVLVIVHSEGIAKVNLSELEAKDKEVLNIPSLVKENPDSLRATANKHKERNPAINQLVASGTSNEQNSPDGAKTWTSDDRDDCIEAIRILRESIRLDEMVLNSAVDPGGPVEILESDAPLDKLLKQNANRQVAILAAARKHEREIYQEQIIKKKAILQLVSNRLEQVRPILPYRQEKTDRNLQN